MSSVNKVMLIGRIGKIERISFKSGGSMIRMSISTSESWKDKTTDEWKEITDWHNCKCSIPAIQDMLEKSYHVGDMIYVEGKIRYSSYKNKEGIEVPSTDILVDQVKKLIGKKSANGTSDTPSKPQGSTPLVATEEEDVDDGLPF